MSYVTIKDIQRRSEYITRLVNKGYNPTVSGKKPDFYDMKNLRGLVFDGEGSGYYSEEFRGETISTIIWYDWDVDVKDLKKLIPYWRSVILGSEHQWGRDEKLLEEYTKPIGYQLPVE